MGQSWDADIEITSEVATRRIERQFPTLAPVSILLLGNGWDNAAYLVNDRFVFRFPRRKIAVRFAEIETNALPLIAPLVPVAVPTPMFLGTPDDDGPYPFAGYVLIPGATACRVEWTDAARAGLAVPLARFLAALHAIDVRDTAFSHVPYDEIRRADIAYRAPMLRARLEKLAESSDVFDVPHLLREAERLSTAAPTAPDDLRLVHGDLYARHVVVDDDRRLCGVIDWGDVHIGDRALDLSIAFSFLPEAARPAFRAAYGTVDDATWDRARFRALNYGVLLYQYGEDVGDAAIRDAGRDALRLAG